MIADASEAFATTYPTCYMSPRLDMSNIPPAKWEKADRRHYGSRRTDYGSQERLNYPFDRGF